jgi:hypothetical protein
MPALSLVLHPLSIRPTRRQRPTPFAMPRFARVPSHTTYVGKDVTDTRVLQAQPAVFLHGRRRADGVEANADDLGGSVDVGEL